MAPSKPHGAVEMLKDIGRSESRLLLADDLLAEVMRLSGDPLLLGDFLRERAGKPRSEALPATGNSEANVFLALACGAGNQPSATPRPRMRLGDYAETRPLGETSPSPAPFLPTEEDRASAITHPGLPCRHQRGRGIGLATVAVLLLALCAWLAFSLS